MLTYRHIGEKVRIIMTATREQERNALAKIREIVADLGEGSYVGTAFEGCFEIAEENIEYDFADSMQARLEEAREEVNRSDETVKTLYDENQSLKQKIAQLERELEWQPYEEKGNVTQFAYENLAGQSDTHQLDFHKAKKMISDLFGFATEKIEIITSVPVYEINRHNQLRVLGSAERKPLYNATDWNYIRFNCCGTEYEMFNDSLRLFN